jgi:hypothetical protein
LIACISDDTADPRLRLGQARNAAAAERVAEQIRGIALQVAFSKAAVEGLE